MPSSDYSVDEAWKEDWFNHNVAYPINQFLITDPTIRQPGFDLNRSDWTILNRYRTGHVRCAATLCDRSVRVAVNRQCHIIVNECPLMKYPGAWAPGASHC